jgi:hypothetical protein
MSAKVCLVGAPTGDIETTSSGVPPNPPKTGVVATIRVNYQCLPGTTSACSICITAQVNYETPSTQWIAAPGGNMVPLHDSGGTCGTAYEELWTFTYYYPTTKPSPIVTGTPMEMVISACAQDPSLSDNCYGQVYQPIDSWMWDAYEAVTDPP